MRSGSGVRLRADGRWEARYMKGKDENGKTLYGFVYAHSREDAEQKRSKALRALMTDSKTAETMMKSELPTLNPEIQSFVVKRKYGDYKLPDALTEEVTLKTEQAFLEQRSGVRIGFLACLYMGVSLKELCALKYSDFKNGVLVIEREMLQNKSENGKIIYCVKREIPVPDCMSTLLNQSQLLLSDNYVMTDSEKPVEKPLLVLNMCRKVTVNAGLGKIHPDELRSTFIRRALMASLNAETVSALTGVDIPTLRRRFGGYIKADTGKIQKIYEDYLPAQKRCRQMNLLVLGAGSHGHAVKETAERLGVFRQIAFLDDKVEGAHVLGKCSEYRSFTDRFPCAFVAIGDNAVRERLMKQLKESGYIIPRLISPDAVVSPSAEIGEGSVVLPQSTVNAAAQVGNGCILSTGSITDYGAVIKDFVLIESAAMITKDSVVEEKAVVESGEVVKSKQIS